MNTLLAILFTLSSLPTFATEIGSGKSSVGTNGGCVSFSSAFSMAEKDEGYSVNLNGLPEGLRDVMFCEGPISIRGDTIVAVIRHIGERYAECLDLQIDDAPKTITVSARPGLLHITSVHRTQNEYAVDGRIVYAFPSEESKDRYVCPHSDSHTPDWAKKVKAAVGQ